MSKRLTSSSIWIVVFTLLTACSSSPESEASTDELPELPAELEDFKIFYERFHTDSSFQMTHISWPLEGKTAPEVGAPGTDISGSRWQPEDWELHKPLEMGGDFVREIDLVGGAVVLEVIRARAGNYAIVRRFARLGDDWNLIYYQVSSLG